MNRNFNLNLSTQMTTLGVSHYFSEDIRPRRAKKYHNIQTIEISSINF